MAHPTQGTTVAVGSGSPVSYTNIGEVISFSLSGDRTTIDTSHLSSTWREFIGGLRDGGTLDIGVAWLPANAAQSSLVTAFGTTTGLPFKITLTDSPATEVTFTGIVTGFNFGAEVDGRLQGGFAVKVTGAITGL